MICSTLELDVSHNSLSPRIFFVNSEMTISHPAELEHSKEARVAFLRKVLARVPLGIARLPNASRRSSLPLSVRSWLYVRDRNDGPIDSKLECLVRSRGHSLFAPKICASQIP